jgi:hypothetical protein
VGDGVVATGVNVSMDALEAEGVGTAVAATAA